MRCVLVCVFLARWNLIFRAAVRDRIELRLRRRTLPLTTSGSTLTLISDSIRTASGEGPRPLQHQGQRRVACPHRPWLHVGTPERAPRKPVGLLLNLIKATNLLGYNCLTRPPTNIYSSLEFATRYFRLDLPLVVNQTNHGPVLLSNDTNADPNYNSNRPSQP